jgi:SAM-dependent methyltransferase
MKPALAFRQPHYPQSWSDLPNGLLILDEINQVLSPWSTKFFGYHLLKIGSLSSAINMDQSPIKHQVSLSHLAGTEDVVADMDDLPLLKHSVDVCILSHALEFSLDPHHVVREANRVLIPDGYLVITGFNPFSLAGLNKINPFRYKNTPWNERFFTPMRVKDWLHLMGYEILTDERRLHSTLAGNMSEGGMALQWRDFAQHFLSGIGSIYVIVAKKRVLPLTPIKPKWKMRPQFQTGKVSSLQSSRHHTKQEVKE